jgi:hypothetical protein
VITARPSFPIVGAVTPVLFGVGLWVFLQSPFALIGAVLGPVMVVAHFADSVRRHRRDERARVADESRAAELAARERWSLVEADRRTAVRFHPSVHQVAELRDWRPRMDGCMDIRAGSETRDGVSGFPWLVNISRGVAVVGEGAAADSVWQSLVALGSAAHGIAETAGGRVTWATGAWIHRGDHGNAGFTIRCSGFRIESVGELGRVPQVGDWQPDDTSEWRSVLERCASGDTDIDWTDRARCSTGVAVVDGQSFRLDLTSESPHILVCGRTGTGKSEFIATLLCDWAERFTATELSWAGLDFKGGATLAPLAKLPNNRGIVTDLDGQLVERALDAVVAEMVDRERVLRIEGVARVEDSREIGRIAVVVDEYPELIRQFPRASEIFADVARRGRSLGVHVVIATQSPAAVHRDGLAANLPVRVCFPLANAHDVSSVLGAPPPTPPAIGRPIVSLGDGRQQRVTVRRGARVDKVDPAPGTRLPALWHAPLVPPIAGSVGFGVCDDTRSRSQAPVEWTPAVGDVVVVGRRGSGRTTATSALTRELSVTVARSLEDIRNASGVVVVDDLDRLHDSLPDSRKHELAALLASRRFESDPPRFVMSVSQWSPRLHGLVSNVLVLPTLTRDAHLATGEPPETFDPSAKPGVGSWRGRRVVVYARTDSIVTDGIP